MVKMCILVGARQTLDCFVLWPDHKNLVEFQNHSSLFIDSLPIFYLRQMFWN